MSKRRFQTEPSTEEEGGERPAPTSAEERRRERKRQRAAREAGNPHSKGRPNWTRRALIIGIPVAVIAVIVIILLFNPFQPLCLQVQDPPAKSLPIGFPPHNASGLSTGWCQPGLTPAIEVYPMLTIRIGTSEVGLPTDIGQNKNYTYAGEPYDCRLPLSTDTVANGGLPLGTIYIISPWSYIYNLSDFFTVWADTHSTVDINASFSSQPVTYTATDLLGFTADSTHSITLFVDNQVSRAGPDLDLDTLSGSGGVYPSCFASIYGTSHTILLSYSVTRSSTAAQGLSTPVLATAGGPDLGLLLYNSPAAHLFPYLVVQQVTSEVELKSLGWLLLRPPR